MDAFRMEIGRSQSHEPSRPCILDLPNELLLDILGMVEHVELTGNDSSDDSGRRDIQNARLVCRRFCALGSQLLVRVVRVQFNEESLARLHDISRHPAIAKGVRCVRVVLHFYNRSLVDHDRFVSYYADVLENQVWTFGNGQKRADSRIPEETAAGLIAEGRAVVATLCRLHHDNGKHSEGDQDHRARLDAVRRGYLTRLEEQESLMRSAELFRLIGAAIARMPAARKLEFTDRIIDERYSLVVPGRDIWDAVHCLMLQPINGFDAKRRGYLEVPNYQCILRVIDAVRSAGAPLLNSIDINLTNSGYPGGLAPAPDFLQEFSSGMQQLEEFSFSCGDCGLVEHHADHLEAFLSACLDTPSLRKLSLDLKFWNSESETIDLGKVMGSRARPNVTNIFLGRVAIHLFELVRFLERLPDSIDVLHQDNLRLLSGTWKEALDVLRRKRCRVIKFGGMPRGAECVGMRLEDSNAMFDSKVVYGYRSAAELYITNWFPQMLNPLQALEDGVGLAELLESIKL